MKRVYRTPLHSEYVFLLYSCHALSVVDGDLPLSWLLNLYLFVFLKAFQLAMCPINFSLFSLIHH